MTTETPRISNGDAPPPDGHAVSWVSLLRTARAPLAVLVLAAAALIVPPQRTDMLAALSDSGSAWMPALLFQASVAALAVSAWYWARTLIDARFDVVGTKAGRETLVESDKRINPVALTAVPWLIVALSAVLGALLIPPGQYVLNLAIFLAWIGAFGALAAMAWVHAPETQEERVAERSTCDVGEWLRRIPVRLRLLARRAPGPPWLLPLIVGVALLVFVVGALASFIDWQGVDQISLPTRIAGIFPGPSAALICLALMIGPLSVLTFLADGLRLRWVVKGQRVGLARPPIILLLLLWVAAAPYLFSLHTVRAMPSALVGRRDDLKAFFSAWANACAPAEGPVRPIIVAVSGGASRAAVWGARVLQTVEEASPTGRGPTVFAVSSVSGGSLGAAAYLALLHDLPPQQLCARGTTDARKAQVARLDKMPLAHDALGPLLAAALAVDIPRALLSLPAAAARALSGHQPQGGDRAEWIERAFEGIWKEAAPEGSRTLFDQPFLALFYDGPHKIRPGMPIWIANGTEIGTGSRLLTVPFGPEQWPFHAAKDALSALNGDVSISTAINNTARFPYLEPSGELLALPDPAHPPGLGEQFHILRGEAREVIDGGYFENEGLQTALELARWLRTEGRTVVGRFVEPIVVQATADGEAKVDDRNVVRCGKGGADDPVAPVRAKPALQLLAPVFGLYNVRGGHSAVVLRQAKADYCPNGFFHFYLPGLKAGSGTEKADVPLNWVLSDGTTARVRAAMTEDDGNRTESKRLIKAFAP